MTYNWQQKEWPHFSFEVKGIQNDFGIYNEKVAKVNGLLTAVSNEVKTDAMVDLMVSEAIKTSEIEGEFLSRKDIASSIRKNLGLLSIAVPSNDKRSEGIAELMIDVRSSYKDDLTEEKIFTWHKMLFNQQGNFTIGGWRTHLEPMQVVSGAMGKEKVHFEAPPSESISKEMAQFLNWFNNSAPGGKNEIDNAMVRSAIAHLYFESIHPFEDGNGRIGRAIAEKALSQGMRRPAMLSLSKAIEAEKKTYYLALEKAQRSMEVSTWIEFFVKIILQAQDEAEAQIDFTLKKARLFDRYKKELNDRQLTAIKRMLDEGPTGFEGGMNVKKYIGITKTSKATATRDLQDLLERGVFSVNGAGRSTSYQINI